MGFTIVAIVFLTTMAFTTVPTPLYGFYQRADDFPTWVVTIVFAAYAIGVLGALFLVGHISDQVGRRRMMLIGIGLEIVAAILFLLWPGVAGLIVARVISGAGIGALTAAASAHLVELAEVADPTAGPARATTVATVVNTGGLALGPLVAGAIATAFPDPTVTPYVVFLVLLTIGGVVLLVVPETVDRAAERRPYRPQRVSLPAGARRDFTAAATAAFAGFAVFGLFTSLAPSVLARVMHVTSPLAGGAVSFSVLASAAVSQVLFAPWPLGRQLRLALGFILAGLAALAVGALSAQLVVFVASGILAGAGVGVIFRGAMLTAGSLAAPDQRGEVLAGMFLFAYAGLALPVLAIGVGVAFLPIPVILLVFAITIGVLVALATVPMIRRTDA
jgi:hypothetical protein